MNKMFMSEQEVGAKKGEGPISSFQSSISPVQFLSQEMSPGLNGLFFFFLHTPLLKTGSVPPGDCDARL